MVLPPVLARPTPLYQLIGRVLPTRHAPLMTSAVEMVNRWGLYWLSTHDEPRRTEIVTISAARFVGVRSAVTCIRFFGTPAAARASTILWLVGSLFGLNTGLSTEETNASLSFADPFGFHVGAGAEEDALGEGADPSAEQPVIVREATTTMENTTNCLRRTSRD